MSPYILKNYVTVRPLSPRMIETRSCAFCFKQVIIKGHVQLYRFIIVEASYFATICEKMTKLVSFFALNSAVSSSACIPTTRFFFLSKTTQTFQAIRAEKHQKRSEIGGIPLGQQSQGAKVSSSSSEARLRPKSQPRRV